MPDAQRSEGERQAGMAGWRRLLLVAGPGIAVMLADTDAGSIVTVAQSGAEWGYRLLPFQFLIIPFLFVTQELTARLGLGTGRGLGELIRDHFGRGWAFLAVAILVLSCFGALVTQLSGLAGVGQLMGVPAPLTVTVAVVAILAMIFTGSYRSVERIVLFFGLFELSFILVAWRAHPDLSEMAAHLSLTPLAEPRYLYLLAANLGTSVMPWAIFYQQSAVIDKGLGLSHLRESRFETLGGAVFCQIVTAALLIAAAATLGKAGGRLENIPEIVDAFTAALGSVTGHVVFALGLTGGALVATIVVCLAAAWGLGEVSGHRHSLEARPLDAPWFYFSFAAVIVLGGGLVASGVDLVALSIAVGAANTLLLPLVLFFLFRLARRELPQPVRLHGSYAGLVGAMFVFMSVVGLYSAIVGGLG